MGVSISKYFKIMLVTVNRHYTFSNFTSIKLLAETFNVYYIMIE